MDTLETPAGWFPLGDEMGDTALHELWRWALCPALTGQWTQYSPTPWVRLPIYTGAEGNGKSLAWILPWRIPMDRGAWWATAHGVAKSWIRLSDWEYTGAAFIKTRTTGVRGILRSDFAPVKSRLKIEIITAPYALFQEHGGMVRRVVREKERRQLRKDFNFW